MKYIKQLTLEKKAWGRGGGMDGRGVPLIAPCHTTLPHIYEFNHCLAELYTRPLVLHCSAIEAPIVRALAKHKWSEGNTARPR